MDTAPFAKRFEQWWHMSRLHTYIRPLVEALQASGPYGLRWKVQI